MSVTKADVPAKNGPPIAPPSPRQYGQGAPRLGASCRPIDHGTSCGLLDQQISQKHCRSQRAAPRATLGCPCPEGSRAPS